MYFRPNCHCRMPNGPYAWLDDPLIRDMMASDGVTETEMVVLLNSIAERRQQFSAAPRSTRHDFGGEVQTGE